MVLAPAAAAPTPDGRVPAPSSKFGWPVTPHVVVRTFDPPEVRWGSGHRGVDLQAPAGSQIVAPADGVVTYSGVIANRGVLSIKHPEGFNTTYEPVSDRVAQGTQVHRGDVIAKLDAGHCEPIACLHWGYKVGDGEYRNPLTLVRSTRPVLLPPL